MPLLPTIQCSAWDLQKILEALSQLRFSGQFLIIDTGHSYTIRDTGGMFLTEVIKIPQEHSGP